MCYNMRSVRRGPQTYHSLMALCYTTSSATCVLSPGIYSVIKVNRECVFNSTAYVKDTIKCKQTALNKLLMRYQLAQLDHIPPISYPLFRPKHAHTHALTQRLTTWQFAAYWVKGEGASTDAVFVM